MLEAKATSSGSSHTTLAAGASMDHAIRWLDARLTMSSMWRTKRLANLSSDNSSATNVSGKTPAYSVGSNPHGCSRERSGLIRRPSRLSALERPRARQNVAFGSEKCTYRVNSLQVVVSNTGRRDSSAKSTCKTGKHTLGQIQIDCNAVKTSAGQRT